MKLRPDAKELLFRYMDMSREELCGGTPVLGRMKELLSYWCQEPSWRSRWRFVKICRSSLLDYKKGAPDKDLYGEWKVKENDAVQLAAYAMLRL